MPSTSVPVRKRPGFAASAQISCLRFDGETGYAVRDRFLGLVDRDRRLDLADEPPAGTAGSEVLRSVAA